MRYPAQDRRMLFPFKLRARGFGTPDTLTPHERRSRGPISLHNAVGQGPGRVDDLPAPVLYC